ncbi:hypothetical protein [Stieleria varia]|uniref:Uncharacterized protein n=1 Tax=Stieleria varia TaxID=2528005 RepID=A0A5C6B334_9BACT|nr:hypothetical protein [Stieleria varia]TWU04874.1 hypothetical protein Pla52n_29190 [Stieleria varia]
MNQPLSPSDTADRQSPKFGKKSIGSLLLVGLVSVYALARPTINQRFGLNLPALTQASSDSANADQTNANQAASTKQRSTTNTADTDSKFAPSTQTTSQNSKNGSTNGSPSEATASDSSATTSEKKNPGAKRGPLADRMRPNGGTGSSSSKSAGVQKATADPEQDEKGSAKRSSETDDAELTYGLLREVRPKYFLSPAGLQYTPGSAEGHRLEHVKRHTVDDPSRTIHGVFDGGMEGAVKTIDRAYVKAKEGTRTTVEKDGSRTIYTVDMGGRIGYQGGREGNRRRKPMARRVKLVLEGNLVITAYPL